jgi:hypothetical protein
MTYLHNFEVTLKPESVHLLVLQIVQDYVMYKNKKKNVTVYKDITAEQIESMAR